MCWNCLKSWLLDIIIPNENKDAFFIHEKNIYEFFSSMKKKGYEIIGPMRVDEISLNKLLGH